MSVQVEQISAYQKRLQFTVPGPEVSRKIEDAFRNLGSRVQIPGFRRGHVPRSLLEARWGKQVRAEVASDLINWEFRQAAVDMEFLGQPEVQRGDLSPGSDFSFAIVVQVRPEVSAKDYAGIPVEWPQNQVSDAEVEAQVQRRLAGSARLEEVTDGRAAEAGDLVLTEIVELAEDGEKVREAGTMVHTSAERYYPGAETLVVGLPVGGSATGTVTHDGRSFNARVKVLGIQVSKTPDLTDELARELGYEGGADGMRVALRLQAQAAADESARNVARVSLLRALIDRNELIPPPAMVDQHLNLLVEELKIQQSYRGRDPRSIRFSDAQMADLRDRAGFSARAALLLEAVAKAEGIVITDEDLEQKYQEIADMRGQRVEAIRGYFAKDNAVEELRRRILEERTLDWLLERAEVKTPTEGAAEAAPAAEPAKKATKKAKPAEAVEAPAAEPPKKAAAKKKAKADEAPAAEVAAAPEAAPAKKKAKKSEA